jgi:hypothetical protein
MGLAMSAHSDSQEALLGVGGEGGGETGSSSGGGGGGIPAIPADMAARWLDVYAAKLNQTSMLYPN